MERFIFNLEPLLTARIAAERTKQVVVAELERERRSVESRLRQQHEMITQGRDELRRGLVGPVDSAGLRFHAGSTMRMMRDVQQMALELANVHQRLEKSRTELARAATQRRAIERLRERRFAEWKRRQAKKDAAALDDLAALKAMKRQEIHQ